MKKIKYALAALILTTTTIAHSELQHMSDTELRQTIGQSGFDAQRIINEFKNLETGLANQISTNYTDEQKKIYSLDFFKQLLTSFNVVGIQLDQITLDGVEYDGSLTIQDGNLKTTSPFPSHFKSIYIGSVKLGDSPSIGAVEIVDLNLGNIKVDVKINQ